MTTRERGKIFAAFSLAFLLLICVTGAMGPGIGDWIFGIFFVGLGVQILIGAWFLWPLVFGDEQQ